MKKFFITLTVFFTLLICSLSLAACGGKQEYGLTLSSETTNGKVILTQNEAKEGEKVRLACMPDAGYRLTSYVVDGKTIEGNTFTMPNKAVKVSANFEVIEYRIEYVLNGGAVEDGNPATYSVEDGDIELIAPTKDGFEFGYWYFYFFSSEDHYVEPEDYKVEKITAGTTGKLTLYAMYYNVPYYIDIDYENADRIEISVENYSAEMGDIVTLSHEMQSEYYEFLYYTVNGEKIEGNSFVMPNSDVTVSAELRPKQYTVTYVLDGGTNSEDNPNTFTHEDDVIYLSDAEKEGYIFIGWYYIDEDGYEIWISYIGGYEGRDMTLYAVFEPEDDIEEE